MQRNRPLNQPLRSLEIIQKIGRNIKHPHHVAAPTIPLQQPARPRGQLQNLRCVRAAVLNISVIVFSLQYIYQSIFTEIICPNISRQIFALRR